MQFEVYPVGSLDRRAITKGDLMKKKNDEVSAKEPRGRLVLEKATVVRLETRSGLHAGWTAPKPSDFSCNGGQFTCTRNN